MNRLIALLVSLVWTSGLLPANDTRPAEIARLEIADASFRARWGSTIEVTELASGFSWSEGPLWDAGRNKLWFTDVPVSKLFSWSENEGLVVELDPSGLPAGTEGISEPGLNGLVMGPGGDLLVANHGARAVQRIVPETAVRTNLATGFLGRRFNSPNDLVLSENGSIFFTDPPYGLAGRDKSPLKEHMFNGVYQRKPDGSVRPVDVTLSRPNGIALSPDEGHLYVAVSDPATPVIKRYHRMANGSYNSGTVWFDMSRWLQAGEPGYPDGMVVAETGEIFATGPGGVYVLSPEGELLARVVLDRSASNSTLGEDGRTLFVTNSDRVLRIRFPGATG